MHLLVIIRNVGVSCSTEYFNVTFRAINVGRRRRKNFNLHFVNGKSRCGIVFDDTWRRAVKRQERLWHYIIYVQTRATSIYGNYTVIYQRWANRRVARQNVRFLSSYRLSFVENSVSLSLWNIFRWKFNAHCKTQKKKVANIIRHVHFRNWTFT